MQPLRNTTVDTKAASMVWRKSASIKRKTLHFEKQGSTRPASSTVVIASATLSLLLNCQNSSHRHRCWEPHSNTRVALQPFSWPGAICEPRTNDAHVSSGPGYVLQQLTIFNRSFAQHHGPCKRTDVMIHCLAPALSAADRSKKPQRQTRIPPSNNVLAHLELHYGVITLSSTSCIADKRRCPCKKSN
eukprot:SAG31_NODE_16584_length_703_cov_1.127483_1_plen_188_part_00